MPSIDLSALKEKLGMYEPQPPVPASRLFKILGPFLYHLAKQPANSQTVQTTHYIWQKWYVEQNKILAVDLSLRPFQKYPGTCFSCGHVHGFDTSMLTNSCRWCEYSTSLRLHFFKDMLEYSYKIHPEQIDKLFSELIYKRALLNSVDTARSR